MTVLIAVVYQDCLVDEPNKKLVGHETLFLFEYTAYMKLKEQFSHHRHDPRFFVLQSKYKIYNIPSIQTKRNSVMKIIFKSFVIFISLLFTQFVFANNVRINVELINLTPHTGYATYLDYNKKIIYGPIVEKNGGQVFWSSTINSNVLQAVGVLIPGMNQNSNWGCMNQNQPFLLLNPNLYTGDTIIITYTQWTDFGPSCTCSGSACDTGPLHK